MAYKYATGSIYRGDIYDEDDAQGNTYIDWTPSGDAVGIVAGGTTVFVASGSTALVGVGTAAPDYTLDVAGDAGFDEYIYHNGDTNTYIRFQDDDINMNCGGKSMVKMSENPSSQDLVTINNAGSDTDFRVKGNNEDNLIRTDAASDKVGIGTSSPDGLLHVSGAGGILFQVDETSGSIGDAILFVTGSGESSRFGVGTSNPGSTFEISGSQAGGLTTFTADVTLNETHFMVTFTGGTGLTGTLPLASNSTGRIYHFFNQLNQGSNPLVVTASGDDTIGDDSTLELDAGQGNSSVSLASNGSQWMIFGLYSQSEGG